MIINYKKDSSGDCEAHQMSKTVPVTNQADWPAWMQTAARRPKHLNGALFYKDENLYLNVGKVLHRPVIQGEFIIKGKGKNICACPESYMCNTRFTTISDKES